MSEAQRPGGDISRTRNLAIIAHVDHGKTTLVDQLLKQSGALERQDQDRERIMDANDLERERGITILAKNTAIAWNDFQINIIDTPGHADFGGEVERILSMVDGAILLVDAVEGPMPQTRFVTQKALARGLAPIVVVNKIDRDGARPDWVVDQTFELFDNLGASDAQLDFTVLFASAMNGYARLRPEDDNMDMQVLFKTVVDVVPPPPVVAEGPLQLQISALDYSQYVGAIGIGRVFRGRIAPGKQVAVVDREGRVRRGKLLDLLGFSGLARVPIKEAGAGDIVAITGIDNLNISDTICDPEAPEALAPLSVDEPTVSVTFEVSNSPFAGRDGKYVTSRQIRDRLDRELISNVALRVETTEDENRFIVAGRGELHLGILIETMRREGYEFSVGRPRAVFREENGVKLEPYEQLTCEVEQGHQGAVMEQLGLRQAELTDLQPAGPGRVRLDYSVPSRGLIGFRSEFLTLTSGTGIMYSSFERYDTMKPGRITHRNNGVLIANGTGKALGYALFNLQERGRLFIDPGTEVYEGMLIGIHSRSNDLVVNPLKGKQLTNVRASGTDENILLTPPIKFDLDQAMSFIADDELMEVTPNAIRLRKRVLNESDRKRLSRQEG